MKKLFGMAVSFVFLLCGAVTVSAWEYIDANDAYSMLEEENVYLLDVRTPCEWFYVGHPGPQNTDDCATTIEGTFLEGKVVNIPYWLWEFNPETKEYEYNQNVKFFDENVVRQFKAGDTIIVMCKTDGRGGYAGNELEDPTTPACQRLEELNEYTIYNLGGGFESPGRVHDGITYVGWKPSGLPYVISSVGAWKPTSDQKGRSLNK